VIICTELGRGGHELLTLLAVHASKRMDGSTGVEPADQSCLGKIYQCGGNPRVATARSSISSNSTGYSPRTSAPAFENFRNSAGDSPPSGSGSCRRGDAAEAVGCTVVATTNLALLASKITPPPPISYPTTCSYVKKIRPLANHNDFVSGRILAEKTLLVGYWNLRMLRKDEVRNR
jgi:hypothetical protein